MCVRRADKITNFREFWNSLTEKSLQKSGFCKIKKEQVFDLTPSVRMKGLEPPRLTTLDPKSSAATNYATCANILQR